jgi:hypothetical protein
VIIHANSYITSHLLNNVTNYYWGSGLGPSSGILKIPDDGQSPEAL